jgi:hypothetical protein
MSSYYSTKPRGRANSYNNRSNNSGRTSKKGPAKQYIHPSQFVRKATVADEAILKSRGLKHLPLYKTKLFR